MLLGAVPLVLGVLLGVLGDVLLGVLGEVGDQEVPPLGLELANR